MKNYSLENIANIVCQVNTKAFPQLLEINLKNVTEILSTMILPDKFNSEEKQLESGIFELLSLFFKSENVKRQYSIGGLFGFKIDLDVGNGKVGVELKIYDNLDTSGLQRLFGQAIYYKNRSYGDNLIVFMVGSDEPDAKIIEIKNFMKQLGVLLIYSKLVNKRK